MELAVDASIGVAEPSAWSRTLLGEPAARPRSRRRGEVALPRGARVRPGYPAALAGWRSCARAGDLEGAAALYRRGRRGAGARVRGEPRRHARRLGRHAEAERAWARAEELERLFAANGGRNLLETAEFDLNHDRNLRSALDRARRGRAERPSVEGDHVLAWALYKNDRCAEARTVSLRSLRLGTLDVDGLYHHSLIEACLGNARGRGVPGQGACARPPVPGDCALGEEARRRSRIDSAAWTRSASPTTSASPRNGSSPAPSATTPAAPATSSRSPATSRRGGR